MLIALDYDDTYTKDVAFWEDFIELCWDNGHTVMIVTMRDRDLDWDPEFNVLAKLGVETVFCNGAAKREVMVRRGHNVDIWIDDRPEGIAQGSTFTPEQLREWRQENRRKAEEEDLKTDHQRSV